ncbi:outer membrane receptor protein involved in Fe transport [Pedobacter alluvionis]|uniref:Outer membrane receptor protein involved in Fe transport n=2 Tax=Pedobacter alluvionis TaxID=475253 RepID=A0A497XS23_9SPHI|nr:outer membrane receptor protein involved in Fe transport [Pedobacter alluvionis]TFB28770.1 TonB-dependent receptor [Pedobacter alluvionis]
MWNIQKKQGSIIIKCTIESSVYCDDTVRGKNWVKKINSIILFFTLFMLFTAQYAVAQNKTSITGKITGISGEAVPGINIRIKGREVRTLSKEDGTFELNNLKPGNYELLFHGLGYKPHSQKISLSAGQFIKVEVRLTEISTVLESVTVAGKTQAAEIRQQAYNVAAIDARKLHNTTYDLNQALNKVSGVRIRESGGLGSAFNFSLNGFTGNQVKFFLDGIPMDNFGTSLQMNNIPINMADRIEVYKGVVPVWLGADALGGAINIVTNTNQRDYLDVSYSYGSFNTHKSAVNAGYTAKSGFTVQVNAFQNYSDNNYKVDVDVANLTTGVYTPMRVRRFHDTYRNETVIANIGVTGKRYADKLLLGITLGQNKADIQTGNRMFDVYGARKRNGDIIMPSLKYLKNNLFIKDLNLSLNANYNLGHEQLVDTVFKQYNWLGESRDKSTDPDAVGGELRRTLYKYKNNNANITANLGYKFLDKHSLALNNTFLGFNRRGKDELDPDNKLNMQPRENFKNILGLGYRYDMNERFNASVFLKNYNQSTTAFQSYTSPNAPWGTLPNYTKQKKSVNKSGYGAAASYFLNTGLQAKASYEKTYRLPENDELFGNPTIDRIENFSLRPESSENANLGLAYQFILVKEHKLHIESNFIYRNSKDFIRPNLTSVGGVAMIQMLNQQDVRTTGIDGEIRYTFKDALVVGVNMTWQNIRNQTKYEANETQVSQIYKDRIPNMPYLYGNANAQYSIKGLGIATNVLNIGYNLTYVHEYYLNWPSQGSTGSKLNIPEQFQHDVNAVYSIKDGRYNIGLECRNLFDAKIYDNFSLQKPGRSINIKLRYFIAGNQK